MDLHGGLVNYRLSGGTMRGTIDIQSSIDRREQCNRMLERAGEVLAAGALLGLAIVLAAQIAMA